MIQPILTAAQGIAPAAEIALVLLGTCGAVAAAWLLREPGGRAGGTRKASGVIAAGEPVARKPLLSDWEAAALPEIARQCRGYHVCPPAHVRDFLRQPGRGWREWTTAFRKVANLSVDFLVVDHRGNPVLAIELNDKTHSLPERQARDAALAAALRAAGVPLATFVPGQPLALRPRLG